MLGIIVEGFYDEKIIRAFTSRILPGDTVIRSVGGKTKLRQKLRGWLEFFRHYEQNGKIHKVLIIRDQDQECIKLVVEDLQNLVSDRDYPFQIKYCVIKAAIEAWLLADEQAIAQAVDKNVPVVHETLEDIQNPKGRLVSILSEAKLNYTDERAGQIAEAADLETIAYRCPCFQRFRQTIADC